MGSPALGQGSNCKLRWYVSGEYCVRGKNKPDVQGILEVLIDLHDRCLVTATVAVVRCCESELVCDIRLYSFATVNKPEKIVTTFRSWLQL
jgi:hypothetical protein